MNILSKIAGKLIGLVFIFILMQIVFGLLTNYTPLGTMIEFMMFEYDIDYDTAKDFLSGFGVLIFLLFFSSGYSGKKSTSTNHNDNGQGNTQ